MAAFKQIVIKTAEELERIIARFDDIRFSDDSSDFDEAVQYVQNPSLDQQLDAWLDLNDVELCNHGRKKVLAAGNAGIITSWVKYFEKHWSDDDGILSWFETESNVLVGDTVDTTRVVPGQEDYSF